MKLPACQGRRCVSVDGHRSLDAVELRARAGARRYGGTTPRGFDCSGFTRYVYAKFHKKLPRTAQAQFNHARKVKHPRVGDLLF